MKFTTAIMSLVLLILVLLSTTIANPISSSSLQTVEQSTKAIDIGVAAADDLSKRHLWYLDCGHLNGYCNRAAYYCDASGLLAYQYEEDTICNAYCKCQNMKQPARPPPPPVPKFSQSPVSPQIPTVVPCPKGSIFDFCKEVDGEVVEHAGEGVKPKQNTDVSVVENVEETVTLMKTPETAVATTKPVGTGAKTAVSSTKTLNMEVKTAVNPTKILDMEVTAPATLSKRHTYFMDCGARQGFCTQNGYFCGSDGKLHRRFNSLSACNRACSCRNLVPKPLVISVVPCPQGSIFDLCKDVEGEVVEHNGTVGDAVESVEFNQTKTLNMEVSPPESLEQEVNSTQSSDMEVKAVETLSKRHNYAMDCGTQQAFCTRYGYYCASNGRVQRGNNALLPCDRLCTCVSLSIVAPKPNLFPVPCGLHSFCFRVDETDAKRNGTLVDAVGSDEVDNNKTPNDTVEPGEVESDKMVGDVAESEETV